MAPPLLSNVSSVGSSLTLPSLANLSSALIGESALPGPEFPDYCACDGWYARPLPYPDLVDCMIAMDGMPSGNERVEWHTRPEHGPEEFKLPMIRTHGESVTL